LGSRHTVRHPAITLARSLSDTFAGIRPIDVLPFIAAQLAGAICGALLARLVFSRFCGEESLHLQLPRRTLDQCGCAAETFG
jgi:glycerol uptake facilitator-like aquaporin